nr:hypothetical protein CPGR_01132 [Mycolicibacter nonchromogenicus]
MSPMCAIILSMLSLIGSTLSTMSNAERSEKQIGMS